MIKVMLFVKVFRLSSDKNWASRGWMEKRVTWNHQDDPHMQKTHEIKMMPPFKKDLIRRFRFKNRRARRNKWEVGPNFIDFSQDFDSFLSFILLSPCWRSLIRAGLVFLPVDIILYTWRRWIRRRTMTQEKEASNHTLSAREEGAHVAASEERERMLPQLEAQRDHQSVSQSRIQERVSNRQHSCLSLSLTEH